jgi:hypothetical protein
MRIHLLRTEPLVSELRDQQVDGEAQAAYMLATSLFFVAAYYVGLIAAGQPLWSLASLLEGLAISVINIYGIFKCLEAAGGRGNRLFAVQLSCLYVPVVITTYIPIWTAFWVIRIGFYQSVVALSEGHSQLAIGLAEAGTDVFGMLGFLATTGALAITYARLVRLVSKVQMANSLASLSLQQTAARPLN